jgi:uncharacterized protein (DUF1800 family)
MKNLKFLVFGICILIGALVFTSFYYSASPKSNFKFPYKRAGLTERQAAMHLLNRFTYGSTPGEVDSVVKMGLEKWFKQQLEGTLPDDSLNNRLRAFDAINLSNAEALSKYPEGFVITNMAVKDSVISKDSVNKAVNKKAYTDTIEAYMRRKGLKHDQELYKQFISQKIVRAAYTSNQLREVLTDFWFNHFNVSLTKGECSEFIPAYERDVIRPNVLGKFDQLLLASAKSPAMLYYLDNFASQGPPVNKQANKPTQPGSNAMMGDAMQPVNKPIIKKEGSDMMMGDAMQATVAKPKTQQASSMMMADAMMMSAQNNNKPSTVKTITPVVNRNVIGLNENYAREVMELHTLGVDGGYTQTDVTQAARVLTGWTIYPISSYGYGSNMKGLVDRIGVNNLAAKGFVHEGDFLFTPNRHDQGEKTVLGNHFDAGGGYEEGVTLLEMLAHHPSAAKFISRKLAIRFVSDNPPQSLINKMVKTFNEQDGDIKQVLITMVSSPEFWNSKALGEKTKSPFELTISAVRSLNANIKEPYQLFNWINKMGQKIYYYQAPTGFPDRGQYWINTGALLSRMNFGLALAYGRIPGVTVNLKALNNQHEPESATAALITYGKIVMPEEDLNKSIKRLGPLLNDPNLYNKVSNAAAKLPPLPQTNLSPTGDMAISNTSIQTVKPAAAATKVNVPAQNSGITNMLAQVVGIIIGSPEYQRR